MDTLTGHIQTLDGMVWQPFAMPLVLVVVGGLITVMTGFVQLRVCRESPVKGDKMP